MSGRVYFDYRGGCSECGGCTDDECRGGCQQRWCSGTYLGESCNRCKNKVDKAVEPSGKVVKVRCNGDEGHKGTCAWDPWKVGR